MSHITQIEKIRERARQQITEGAVTEDYKLDRKQAIAVLNEALATEIVCVLRYSFHYFMATGKRWPRFFGQGCKWISAGAI
jgi:bacterioferritin